MIIYNVRINTMDNGIIENGYIEISNGKIIKISAGNISKVNENDIDGKGKDIYPGFIDPHTHLGIIGDGLGFESDDCNEESDPVTPQMRTLDGINPFDKCFEEAYSAGITTVLSSPGSANTICGEIIALKTYGRCVDDMMIKPVGMKFALGENPKTVYKDRDESPVTRMATAALIREALYKAKKYLSDKEKAQNNEDYDEPDYDIKCESLIPVLKHEVSAYFHCHRADDILTAIRICREFELECILVHATEGYKVADIIAKSGAKAIAGPIISDRCKPELKNLSTENAKVLENNGVLFSICTDHPVIPVQYLFMSGAIAVKSGLDRRKAMEAITINAAKIAGIDNRVGSITEGKDADLVIFDSDPFDVMSSPLYVFINGKIVYRK